MQLPKSKADEERLAALLWSPAVKDNPLKFVQLVFPWSKPGPLQHEKGPRQWQADVLRQIADNIKTNKGQVDFKMLRMAIASGRGIGKSALLAWIILWFVTTRIGSTTMVSANSESQLRSITWAELLKWQTLAIHSHWFEPSATRLVPAKWVADIVEREFKIGSRYWYAEGRLWSAENPDGYAGAHNALGMLLILDESSSIPDSIWSVSQGFFTENSPDRFWFAFSNPRRSQGYFYECFNSRRDFWVTKNIDARMVEGTDKAIYTQIEAEYGPDSPEFCIEVKGDFSVDDADQFISPAMVDAAVKREKEVDASAPVILGVDPARFGTDSTVMVVRQGRTVLEIIRNHGDDTMASVGRIIEAIDLYKPDMICIDEGGLGAGIVDRLKEQRYKVRGVNFGNAARNGRSWGNKRAEMWGDMRDWLKTGTIPEDRRLKQDLTGPTKKPNSSGVIFLEAKKDMKARGLPSPDTADALALTFAHPFASRAEKKGPIRFYNPSTHHTSWLGS